MNIESQGARALFQHEPRREQEVVCLFGAVVHLMEPPLVIEKVQTPFPDCTAQRTDENKPVRIEFELYGRHFIDHGHSTDECDMLICWLDDWGSWPTDFEVVELHKVVTQKCPHLIQQIDVRDPGSPWNRSTFFDRCRSNRLDEREMSLIASILDFASDAGLGPQWLADPTATFAVRDHDQFFKMDAAGRIHFPFSRLKAGTQFPELVRRLNQAIGTDFFAESDWKTKGKGGKVSEIFRDHDHLMCFLNVWRWFADQRNEVRLPG